MRISSSDINAFLRCRRRWDYSSDNRQHLESVSPAPTLFLGTGVHDALEAFYKELTTDPATYFEAWAKERLAEYAAAGINYNEETLRKNATLGYAMLQGYVEEYGADPRDDRDGIHLLTTEQEFALPIPATDGGLFVGRLDGLMEDARGLVWVFETKTYTQAPRTFLHILQQAAYVWAANRLIRSGAFAHLGLEPTRRVYGTLYNGLRKQVPGPRVTAPLFVREWVERSRQELYLFERDLARIYRVMSNPALEIYPTYTDDCSWCSYRSPCEAASLGEDEAALLKLEYRVQPSRGSVYQDD